MDEQQAIALLRKYAKTEQDFKGVLAHVKAVQKVALRLAEKHPKADKAFIRTASLLHDIGRFEPGKIIQHGIRGAEILRRECLEERYALVCERHIGPGIPKEEVIAKKLDLPVKDYLPQTIEEKIITHADNLIFGIKEKTSKDAIERFRKEIDEACALRVKKLAEEVEK